VAADPGQPGRLFAAAEEGLFRTTDDGASWQRLGGALDGEDVEAVLVGPDGKVYAGTFHGVFRSDDGGESWTSLAAGLPNTDVRALAIHAARLWAGTAGNGVWSRELP
jgi:ligand-binding sensor domain-containing protein